MPGVVDEHARKQAEQERRIKDGELVYCGNQCGRVIEAVSAHPFEYGGRTSLLCRKCCPRCDD